MHTERCCRISPSFERRRLAVHRDASPAGAWRSPAPMAGRAAAAGAKRKSGTTERRRHDRSGRRGGDDHHPGDHRRTPGTRALGHDHPRGGARARHRHPDPLPSRDTGPDRGVPAVRRRGRRASGSRAVMRHSACRRHGPLHGVRVRGGGPAPHPRLAALRPPIGLHDLRADRRLRTPGSLLPLRHRGQQLRRREARAPHRERQPDDRARYEQVHPLRQVRPRLS